MYSIYVYVPERELPFEGVIFEKVLELWSNFSNASRTYIVHTYMYVRTYV